MKGGGHRKRFGFAQQKFQPIGHFPGRFCGKRHRQEVFRIHLPAPDQPGDPAGQGTGLAGSRSRDDDQRTAFMGNRLNLGLVETGQDIGAAFFDTRRRQMFGSGGRVRRRSGEICGCLFNYRFRIFLQGRTVCRKGSFACPRSGKRRNILLLWKPAAAGPAPKVRACCP
jgi:hypothetical protein